MICKRDQFKLLFLEWGMTYLSKNRFRIKGKRHYFYLRTCWKISPIFSWHRRENTGEWGKKELRSTLNWKSDAAFIDQFLSIPRVSRKVFILRRSLRGIEHMSQRIASQNRAGVQYWYFAAWAFASRITYRVNISTARTKSCVRNKRNLAGCHTYIWPHI